MNKEEIEQWLKKYKISNYTIGADLVVDVYGSVYLYYRNLTKLPFQFGNVTGYFNCSNNQLTSLQYCPTAVAGFFDCHHNQLTSLQYCPTTVSGTFNCSNNQLTSLQYYCPTSFGRGFYCSNNPFIVTKENEESWLQAIKNHKKVYHYIQEPTEAITSFYKMMYEI